MTLSDQLATDLAVFYETDEFARTATYTPPSGSDPVSCTVLIDYGSGPQGEGADDMAANATIRVRVSEVATLEFSGVFTIGSDSWEVMNGDKSSDGLEWIAMINRR